MTTLITLTLPGGGEIAAEALDAGHSGPSSNPLAGPVMRGIARGGIVERTTRDFGDAIAVVRPMASLLIDTLKDLAEGTDGVEVKFGVKFNAEAGVVLASASSEASLEVQVKWSRPPAKTGVPTGGAGDVR